MTITYHPELIQGSDEWLAARCGMITAGSMDLILTPTLKVASNEKERQHLYELAAQRINSYVEPSYIGDDMLRGLEDEVYARAIYSEKYAQIEEVGMVTNDRFGFVIGFSPDGLVGDDGLIECKSRRQKYQAQTIILDEVPTEYMLQIQSAMLISERKWCDFISYSGGMPMYVKRVFPDPVMQGAIREAATSFEARIRAAIKVYEEHAKPFHMTERRVMEDIIA